MTAVLAKTLTPVKLNDIRDFVGKMLDHFRKNHAAVCDRIEKTGVLSPEDRSDIIEIASKFVSENAETETEL